MTIQDKLRAHVGYFRRQGLLHGDIADELEEGADRIDALEAALREVIALTYVADDVIEGTYQHGVQVGLFRAAAIAAKPLGVEPSTDEASSDEKQEASL